MVSKDSVITLTDNFVTADKIKERWRVKGFRANTVLTMARKGFSDAILVETKHFCILVSPRQKFITSETEFQEARSLTSANQVLTSEGFEKVENVVYLPASSEMMNLQTAQKAFYADAFCLLCD